MITELFFVFISSTMALFILRKVAKRVGLVDKPNARKLHQGAVPLVGGLAICFAMVQYLFYHPQLLQHHELYITSIITLIVIGVIDDKIDLNFKIRLAVQAGLACLMVYVAHITLGNAGNLFGFGDISLGYMSTFFTIIAVIGGINAFNMVDGMDGLLGSLANITFLAIAFMLFRDGQSGIAYVCLAFVFAILPYIMFNLGVFSRRRKVFMGDAGSMMIGFSVIWILLSTSQGELSPIRPSTALWFIAIPLMDMVAITIRRLLKKRSPFRPDRKHLHHIVQRFGISANKTLIIICCISLLCAFWGIIGEVYQIPEPVMFWSFIATFMLYLFTLMRIWKVSKRVRRILSIV